MSWISTLRPQKHTHARGAAAAQTYRALYQGKLANHHDDVRPAQPLGRDDLMRRLTFREDGVWIDLGCGTGASLELLGDRVRRLGAVYLVDSSQVLLQAARAHIARRGWDNVHLVHDDVTNPSLRLPEADVVTFSYSLSLIPDWFMAIENAFRVLRVNGQVGAVDFYVSRKHPKPGFARHPAATRWFWPWWFAHDDVFLNADHVPYLHQLFEPLHFEERRGRINRLPFARPPYYLFIGRK
jgi:S-adenosylmethionine-diacylgycerolhomoserine-N-methlytransferase